MERAAQSFGHSHPLRDLLPMCSSKATAPSPAKLPQRRYQSAHICAATTLLREDKVADSIAERDAATNQIIREGHFEADLVDRQVKRLIGFYNILADFAAFV